jgi:hypothetical protein
MSRWPNMASLGFKRFFSKSFEHHIRIKNIAQHTSCAICEFSGITVFNSYFRLAENTRLRKSQTAQGEGTLATIIKKTKCLNKI